MKDLTVREILEKKAMLKASIENQIQIFTNETGVIVAAINLDSYAKRDLEGNLLQSNINVSIAVQI
jgi:hypothetical protein